MKPATRRALALLEDGWTCSQQLVERSVGYAYGARIAEVRAAGFVVAKRRCQNPKHRHRNVLWEYRVEPDQIRLAVDDGQVVRRGT